MISVIASGIRCEKWARLYSQLARNSQPFELVIVGNKLPATKMQPGFHFIYSNVKPAQCAEIAFRYSTGDHVFFISDDGVFGEGTLDNLYEMALRNDNELISPRLTRNGIRYPLEQYRYWPSVEGTPEMSVGLFCKREVWNRVGGIDNRFIASMWDLDLAMRHYEAGGKVVYAENVCFEEEGESRQLLSRVFSRLRLRTPKEGLYASVGRPYDRPLLDSLWTFSDTAHPDSYGTNHELRRALSRRRLDIVHPFVDRHLLTVSQGTLHDRWP